MLYILNDRKWITEQHPIGLLIIGILLLALVNLSVEAVMVIIYTPFVNNYGIRLPIWLYIIIPAVTIIIMYPTIGVPIAKSFFGHPLSRQAIVLQALVGLFVLPILTVFTEVGIIYLVQFATLLTPVPIVGRIVANIGGLLQSWSLVVIFYTTYLATVLGVWCSLALYWLMQTVRS